jgi:glycosyltransferase involved in cell wall biosynthesis
MYRLIVESALKGLIVVVNYNQATEIENALTHLADFAPKERVIVIDDGSIDGSDQTAEKLGYEVFRHGTNRGVGAALRSGFDIAVARAYDYVVVMSSNGKMRPEDLRHIVGPVLSGEADFVTGDRFMRGGGSPGLTLFRKLAIPAFGLFAWPILGKFYVDVTCGYRAFTTDFLKDRRMNLAQPWLDRYELEYYLLYWATRLRLRIAKVPVTIRYDHLQRKRVTKIKPLIGWWSMIRPFVYLGSGFKK